MKRISVVLVVLLAVVSAGSLILYTPDKSREALEVRWATPPSATIEVQGMDVHIRDEGASPMNPPLLLLHGTSASLHTWEGWTNALKADFRVIRVDLPGFGLTGPHPESRYGIEDYVSFVIAVLDALNIEQAHVAGNSLGGYIAWKTAVDHPQRVNKLVLLNAAGYAYQSESVPIGFRIAQIPWLAPVMERILPRSVVRSSVENVYGDPAKVTPELVDRYYELTLRAGNRGAVAKRFEQMDGAEFEDQLQNVMQPTLILWGQKDRLIPVANALRFHQDIVGSELVVFDNLGHVPHEESPQLSAEITRQFLLEE